jgi:hypothetical protein
VIVTFQKLVERRVVTWEATHRSRRPIPGPAMALGRPDRLPHDVTQLVVEGVLGIDRGFWGSVAAGATFKSMRCRRTAAGRAVIAANRADLDAGERLVGEHVGRWQRGEPTPVADALDELTARWAAMGDGERLALEWPTLRTPARA